MLGKLLKYEFKATGRTFLPMFGMLLVMSLVTKFFYSRDVSNFEVPQVISMMVFIFIIAAIAVMTLVITIQRFNKNLLTDEGYLSFTLPVKAHTHIDAKMIVAFVWTVLSVLVSMIAILILMNKELSTADFSDLFGLPQKIIAEIGGHFYLIIAEAVLLVIVAVLGSITEIYAAVTLGNMSSKHKLLAGVGSYIGFGIVQQIVASVLANAFMPQMEEFWSRATRTSAVNAAQGAEVVLLVLILYSAVFGVAFYFLTDWMLRKKLNLE